MSKRILVLLPLLLVFVGGCSSGDTPVETVKAAPTTEPQKGSTAEGVQSSNMPDVAKNAVLGKK